MSSFHYFSIFKILKVFPGGNSEQQKENTVRDFYALHSILSQKVPLFSVYIKFSFKTMAKERIVEENVEAMVLIIGILELSHQRIVYLVQG